MGSSWESVFQFLFKYSPFLFEKGRFVIGTPWPAIVVLAAGVAATVWSYARARAATTRRERVVLAVLRAAALAVVFFCLCQPALVLSTAVPQQSFVGVLLDDSRSMRIADGGTPRGDFMATAFGKDSALLRELTDKFKLRFFRFAQSPGRL